MKKPANIQEYIGPFPENVRSILEEIRATIKRAVPEAQETISYGMPAFKYHGMLVYFAAYKKHIGFYATPDGHKEFENELAGYQRGKGSVQFPLNKQIPFDLIAKMAKFRGEENRKKALMKQKDKKKI